MVYRKVKPLVRLKNKKTAVHCQKTSKNPAHLYSAPHYQKYATCSVKYGISNIGSMTTGGTELFKWCLIIAYFVQIYSKVANLFRCQLLNCHCPNTCGLKYFKIHVCKYQESHVNNM